MLRQVAEGVLIHTSEFCQSNAVVVSGGAGVLVIDPGIRMDEIVCLTKDIAELDQPVVAGFSTHPHWDHLLWIPELGSAPRYGTARCAASVRERLSGPDWRTRVAGMLPPDIAEQIPLELLRGIAGLPADITEIPWDGPLVRTLEHQAHAPGHAALLIEERGVLVAGDMLSDVLIPMLDLSAADPIEDYIAALQLLESWADRIDVLVPGHGSIAGADEARARIEQDSAYLRAVRDGAVPSDPRVGPAAAFDWVPGLQDRQLRQLADRRQTHL